MLRYSEFHSVSVSPSGAWILNRVQDDSIESLIGPSLESQLSNNKE
jgi:hypothetical protein